MLAIIDKEFEELKQFMDYLNEFDLNMTYYEKLEVFNILNKLNKEKLEQEILEEELFEKYINYN
jgi:hypothetical protein